MMFPKGFINGRMHWKNDFINPYFLEDWAKAMGLFKSQNSIEKQNIVFKNSEI